jgi:hypothetical protein
MAEKMEKMKMRCNILDRVMCSVAMATATIVSAQPQRTYIIDFEEYAEDTPITTQYERWGVRFSAASTNAPPIVAREGNPIRAHASNNGGNDPRISSGVAGLTDPLVNGDYAIPSDLVMDFNPPITSLRLFVIDIDNQDQVTLRAFRRGSEVDFDTVNAGNARAGDAVSTRFDVSAAEIDRVVVDVGSPNGTMGYAIDFVSFTRACGVVPCRAPDVRVFQERTAGAGDFVSVGSVGYFLTSATASELYAYGVPDGDSYNGPLVTPVTDRTHLILADTADGVTLMVVHDNPVPDNNGGGRAEMRVTLTGDCTRTVRTVQDDPTNRDANDVYVRSSDGCVFTSRQSWSGENTDGCTISGLDPFGVLDVSFADVNNNSSTPVIDGLTEWRVYSSGGSPLTLDLVEGRRVRFLLVPPCPADFNNDNFLDFFDYSDYVDSFESGSPRADFNGDGFLDFFDYADFVAAFELGC